MHPKWMVDLRQTYGTLMRELQSTSRRARVAANRARNDMRLAVTMPLPGDDDELMLGHDEF